MKKALLKDSVKEIKNTFKRFISILLMAFLGVGFFAGLRATSPDMVDTIDKYYDEQNVYDIQVISTLGLTSDDIEAIKNIENVEQVVESYEVDGKIEMDSTECIAKFICLSDLNKPVLEEGDMPQNENECVVEERFLKQYNKKIGDTIIAEIEDTSDDEGETIAYLKQKEIKIVGTVLSPLYISSDRGTSKLGAGKVDYYIYIPKENINAKDVYTSIYVKVKNGEDYTTSSKEYEDYIEEVKNNIETIKEEREQARREALTEKANQKVIDAENELQSQKNDAQKQLDEAQKEINNAKKQIQSAENTINENKKNADTEFAVAESQITTAKTELEKQEQELTKKEQEANKQFEELENQKAQLQNNLNEINVGLENIQTQYNVVLELLKDPSLTEEDKQTYELQKLTLEAKINELKQNKQTVEEGIAEIEAGITTGKQELQNGKNQLNQAKEELNKQEIQLTQTKTSTYAQIETARKQLQTSKQELAKGEQELNKNQEEFEQKIKDAEKELADAKEKILEIEKPNWYILDRNSNSGYVSIIQDSDAIENIGKVFPVVFFVVAALISLTSMTRMVEEQRLQIGTLKALGYNKLQIMSKYIIYAGFATIIGSLLGMSVGFVLLPKIIWTLYGILYKIGTSLVISFNMKYGLIGLILICICIIGATIYTVLKELKEMPAILMRPKAPKSGHRVLLEKIPFIWNRLNFSKKVTVRNLFRYKKRFYMTIIGILGCTALLVTGFGIKDSVSIIIPKQFENIFMYDFQIKLKDSASEEEKDNLLKNLEQKEEIEKIAKVYITSGTAIHENDSEEVQIIIPDDENTLDGIINIKDLNNKEKVKLTENEICLTDKAAQLLGVKAGDTITIKDNDNKQFELKISNIVENYVSHYIFMSKQTYENIYQEEYKTNIILTRNVDLETEKQDELTKAIMDNVAVSGVTNMKTTINQVNDMMNLLNYVVVVLIVASGLLAIVVLYNLSNVNISERKRELATIKVLGFYDKEVYKYVVNETIILTIIGIFLGLFFGYFLNFYIIETCEINMLRFSKYIAPQSYVYATIITIIFTIIVNIATYFALKKIDMIESLKSIE
ncbi:MAG: FtsX-like permease family protein [Clostridia bacterium]